MANRSGEGGSNQPCWGRGVANRAGEDKWHIVEEKRGGSQPCSKRWGWPTVWERWVVVNRACGGGVEVACRDIARIRMY